MRETIMYCEKHEPDRNGQIYQHFYPNPGCVSLCFSDEKPLIVKVMVREDTEGSYFGWWDTSKGLFGGPRPERFTHVYGAKFLVAMCFAYGMPAAEEAGDGVGLAVTIEEIT